MQNKIVVNTFTEGMNKDIDKSLLSNKSYLDAHNFRMITTKGNSTGSLETIKGNKSISDTLITAGQFIIGSCEIRDNIVLFTTNNTEAEPTGGRSMLWLLQMDLENEVQTSLTKIYDDAINYDGSLLLFSVANPIKAISRYETPNVQKIYWTDGFNHMRYANIGTELTITGEAYEVGVNPYLSVDKLEFLPKFVVSKPTLVNIVGGNIKTGMIAYSYQLYRNHGSPTAFSPVSQAIHVTADSDFLSNTLNYNGDKEPVTSGKGFIIGVDTTGNVGFDRLRLVRIEYQSFNSLPRVIISNEIAIDPFGSQVNVTDTGDTLGELTIDEFNIASTELFKCQDIAVKDNILFTANIEKSDIEIGEWDARAVRFSSSSYGLINDTLSGDIAIVSQSEGTFLNWDDYVYDHDGINHFNNPNNDGNALYAYKYQTDGATLGAEGPNIKIDFSTTSITIDTSAEHNTFFAGKHTSGDDKSYLNYASPWKGDKLNWQRDEIYRLFVVFGNDRGQTADPKWICDLRMPSLHDDVFTNSSSENVYPYILALENIPTGRISSRMLYPRVYFKSFPTGATWAQIYRVKRERKDRSVLTQALVIPTLYDVDTYRPTIELDTALLTTNGAEIIKLVSPEINITRNINKQAGDYLQYVTSFTDKVARVSDATKNPNKLIFKFLTNIRHDYSANVKTDINEAEYAIPALLETDYIVVDGKKYSNYYSLSKGSSGLVVSYDNESWSAEGTKYAIVNYKSNVFGSQYGGHTYEDRFSNVSIPCSDVIRSTDINEWKDVTYGDTYINYFDVSTLLADLVQTSADSKSVSAYIPLESSINCSLRHDTSSSHLTHANDKALIRQEYLGTHDYNDFTYEQEFDLYLYNTVYSQQIDVKYAIPLDTSKILETEFDCMIKASRKKINGELSDSWSTFAINEYIEVDTSHGPVNALKLFNDNLHFFQDKACGILSVNERSLINDKSTAQLVLGTGGVLDRYQYVSTQTGSKDRFSIVTSLTGLYWYDRLAKSIYKFSGGLMNLSKAKYIQSYLTSSLDNNFKVLGHNDVQNDEILFTFFMEDDVTNSFTISYNEPVDSFVSFYDFIPTIYIPYQHRYLTTTNAYYCGGDFNRNRIYLHDSNLWDRCYFYALGTGTPTKYVNSTIELVFNPDYNYTKVFDNLFYISNTSSKSTMTGPVKTLNVDTFSDTFHNVQCYNDFQNTGSVALLHKTNIERRERGWTLNIPRNIVSSNISNDPNIFTSVDSTQLFKERMRDKYLISYFTYVNDGTYDRFTVSNMGLKYRISFR